GKFCDAFGTATSTHDTDNVQDNIFREDAFGQGASQLELDGFWHHEIVQMPGRHGIQTIRRANAKGQGAQGPVGIGVRVGAQDDIPRHNLAVFDEHDVLDAITLFIHLGAGLFGELLHESNTLGDLNGKGRHRVIGEKIEPLWIKDAGSCAVALKYLGKIVAKAFDGRWSNDVVEKQLGNR